MQFPNYPLSPSRGGSTGSLPVVSIKNPKNSTPLNNPPSPVTNVPNDPDSDPDPIFRSFFASKSSGLSEFRNVKHKKPTHKKNRSKKNISDPIKQCAQLTAKLPKSAHYSKVKKFKQDDYPFQCQVYFLDFMN